MFSGVNSVAVAAGLAAGAAGERFGGVASGHGTISLQIRPVHPPDEAGELRARGPEPRSGRQGPGPLPPGTGSPRPGPPTGTQSLPLPEGAADMPGQQTCAPVIVTLPARLDAEPPNRPPARSPRRHPRRACRHRRPDRRRVLRPLSYPEPAQGAPQGHRPGRAGALCDPPGWPPAPDHRLRRHSPAAGGLPHPPARPDGPVTDATRQPRLPGGHDQPGALCGGPPGRPCGDDCKPDYPPAVLADALGVSPGTAMRHAFPGGAGWSAHAAGGMVVSAFSAAEIQSLLVRESQRTAEFFPRRGRQV